MSASHSASLVCSMLFSSWTAALLTSTSSRPKRSSVRSNKARTSASLAASARTKATPSRRIRFRGSRRALATTRAPSVAKRSAIARPMPRVPPVTIATLPSRVPIFACSWSAAGVVPGSSLPTDTLQSP